MAKNYFKSYIWLLETLQSHGGLTLKELQSLWMRSSVNDERKELAPRTLYNHIQSISDIFGIDIECDRSDNTYHIKNEDVICFDGIRQWMLEALSLNSLLNESAGLKDRIIFENVPSCQKHLTTVIQAIRDGKVLDTVYKGYGMRKAEIFILEPWCLREFKRRWYLFARKADDNDPHLFALDRFQSMAIGETEFSMPKEFNANEYFAGIYGIRIYPDQKPQSVTIKAGITQANYFRSLPLHPSQEEIEAGDDYAVFRYFLTPDFDFKQDILSFGAKIEVLEPAELRTELKDTIDQMARIYDRDN